MLQVWSRHQHCGTMPCPPTAHTTTHLLTDAYMYCLPCRYKKAADWALMSQLVQDNPGCPIIGNGDILTHYEAADRWQQTGCAALMVGRGALIKPWVFQEIREVGAGCMPGVCMGWLPR